MVMYKLFFWDSIDISIRGVVVPDNDIVIEETLDHERGICYDVINFTYPDSRIGRYLAANFGSYVGSPNELLVPGEDSHSRD